MPSDLVLKRILILEDEKDLRTLYQKRLTRKGYYVDGASTAEECLAILKNKHFHVALVDICLPDMSGLDFLNRVKQYDPIMQVIMITAYGSIESAVQAMKNGAYDYLTKPCNLEKLELVLEKAIEKNILHNQNLILKETLETKDIHESFVYQSKKMRRIVQDIEKVAPTESPVIIEGESGTGKELVANSIHKLSFRKDNSFIVINCGNLQEELIENELFGHEKGAYTGASQKKCGLVELANKGTLFIDEIGEMHPSAQTKLLRILENKTFRRVGGSQELQTDARIISATNRSLSEEVAENRFRQDLFYRLNVVHITIPPLRDRHEDIPLLVDYFLEKKNKQLNLKKTIHSSAKRQFCEYDWPGNVRELSNLIERALILSKGNCIETKDLHFNNDSREKFELLSLKDIEREHILKVLQFTKGNKTEASKILDISVRNLYRKLMSYEN